jgi:hypothetical protein
MDVLTTKGLKTLDQCREAIGLWHRHNPRFQYHETPNDQPADIDGIITCDGRVYGVAEMKCRVSMTVSEFRNRFRHEWLLTYTKITKGLAISEALRVPFVGFLYFPAEKILLVKRIFDPSAGLNVEIRILNSTTQRTVNGGAIDRDNAYIDMSKAEVIYD